MAVIHEGKRPISNRNDYRQGWDEIKKKKIVRVTRSGLKREKYFVTNKVCFYFFFSLSAYDHSVDPIEF